MGALMDEYERALQEFITTIHGLNQDKFTQIVDPETRNSDCVSFKSVVTHVVSAGYAYSNYIRKVFDLDPTLDPDTIAIEYVQSCESELDSMFDYMLATVRNLMDLPEDDFGKVNIPVRWKQSYDLEQILEHAIVHLLRHRRQLEHFWTLI